MAIDLEDRLEELFMRDANARRVASVSAPRRTRAWRGVVSFAAAAALVAVVAIAALTVLRGEQQSAAPTTTVAPTTSPAPVTLGTVSGKLSGYGSDHIPALTIYALPVNDTSDVRYVVLTERWAGSPPETQGGGTYTLSVPPGTYYFVGYAREEYASGWVTAYTRFVTCGLQQSCTDHSLVPVTVVAGQRLSNIDLMDWRHTSWPGTSFPLRPR